MKKRTIILFAIFAIVVCLLIATILFLSVGRAGGEIGFEATIDKIENGIAYATVTDDNAGFGARKLPNQIEFSIDGLDEMNVGDEIYGNYIRGTIKGNFVFVACIEVKTIE